MTNPYLRHPFLTDITLATLQEVAGPRVFLGLAAGGSEATGGEDRSSRRLSGPQHLSARAVRDRGRAAGLRSGRPRRPAGIGARPRGRRPHGMLRTAGRHADQALIWATADSDGEG